MIKYVDNVPVELTPEEIAECERIAKEEEEKAKNREITLDDALDKLRQLGVEV